MARTKHTARKDTGGRAPKKLLASKAQRCVNRVSIARRYHTHTT